MVVRMSSDSTFTIGLEVETSLICTAVVSGNVGVGSASALPSLFRRLRVALMGLVKRSERINSAPRASPLPTPPPPSAPRRAPPC